MAGITIGVMALIVVLSVMNGFQKELRARILGVAAHVQITGLKGEQKVYHRYTGYPGGLRSEDFRKRFQRKPEAVVQDAIVGMLPHTKLGRAMAHKLKVYRGDKHPHQAQKPEAVVTAGKSD